MAEMLIKSESLTALADKIRALKDTSQVMSLDDMSTQLNIQRNDSSNLTVDGATVIVPSGYYASQATKSVLMTDQATPSISIDNSGLITATVTQTAGYVAYGSQSVTKQLAFQPAKTITPSTTGQIAVSSGYYTGGAVTVNGDSNLIASNIKSGVSIFGVNGTYSGNGGDIDVDDMFVTRNFTSYTNNRVSTIGNGAFAYHGSLSTIAFPTCTHIGNYAFYQCTSLASISLPACTIVGDYAFYSCRKLTSVNLPMCTDIGSYAFYSCDKLTFVDLPACINVYRNAFYSCIKLTSVNLSACKSIDAYAFQNCSSLSFADLPVCTYIGYSAFMFCTKLTSVNLPVCSIIANGAFRSCWNLSTIILGSSLICSLANSIAFSSTPYSGYSGAFNGTPYIYVPSSLVATYQTATNWSYFSSYFSAIEDMPN